MFHSMILHEKNICESATRCPKICRQSMTKPPTSGAHSLPFCGSDVDAVCGNRENPLWMVVISVDTIFIEWPGSVITCDTYVEYHDDDRYLWDLEYHLRSLPFLLKPLIETAPPRERMRVAWAVCIADQDNWSKNVPVVCSLEHEELKGAVKHQGRC